MPRTADHDQRRAQIADAVTDLIASGGLAAVTVARTADRAGISVGLVQHYFPAKDDMLLHAFERVGAAVAARVADVIAGGVRHERSIADVLAAALAEYLPLDGRRRAEFRVTRTFAGRALENPRLAEVNARTAATTRAEIARAVTNGFECGEVDPAADPALAAARLAAATEGLATALYRDPGERDRALAVLRSEIDAVFTGECRQYTG